MIKEGREIAAIHPNMIVKIPMTVEGLKAVKVLHAEGIKTNVTLIFTANQALLAARAGATYVSPFLGRLDDISTRGVDLIREIAEIFEVAGIETEIIAASVRNPIHVTDCALAGADIATVPYNVIVQMTKSLQIFFWEKASFCKCRVVSRCCVAFGKYKTVTISLLRILWINIHFFKI